MKQTEVKGVKIQYNQNLVRIIDGYKITKAKDMRDILTWFTFMVGYKSKRTIFSWIREWKAHNRLYKLRLFREHTRDCDLEENEKWYRLIIYQILGI